MNSSTDLCPRYDIFEANHDLCTVNNIQIIINYINIICKRKCFIYPKLDAIGIRVVYVLPDIFSLHNAFVG